MLFHRSSSAIEAELRERPVRDSKRHNISVVIPHLRSVFMDGVALINTLLLQGVVNVANISVMLGRPFTEISPCHPPPPLPLRAARVDMDVMTGHNFPCQPHGRMADLLECQ